MQFFFPLFDYYGAPSVAAFFLILLIAESRYKLRQRKQNKTDRIFINAKVAAFALPVLRIILIPALVYAAVLAERWNFGLLNLISMPSWISFILAFLFIDYGNYLWHLLNHRVLFLWRFHNVHHTDLDLDVTTAWRFHAIEVFLSVFFRAGVVLLIGAAPLAVLVYEIFFEAANNFHHSNLRLPFRLEKKLVWIIVTPRMHGIHHSIVKRETDSNFCIIFTFWDRIHNTIRLNIAQKQINIGVPAYRDRNRLKAKDLLLMPFKEQRPWRLPDESIPDRTNSDGSRSELHQ